MSEIFIGFLFALAVGVTAGVVIGCIQVIYEWHLMTRRKVKEREKAAQAALREAEAMRRAYRHWLDCQDRD